MSILGQMNAHVAKLRSRCIVFARRAMDSMRAHLHHSWSWWASAALIIVATAAFMAAEDWDTRSKIGGAIGGVLGALALVWLIAAYLQQGKELALQRHELALQREALVLQRDEFRKMSKYAALDQIARMLTDFDQRLANLSIPNVKDHSDLVAAFLHGMNLFKPIIEGENDDHVFEEYQKLSKLLAAGRGFLSVIVSAVTLYEDASSEQRMIQPSKDITDTAGRVAPSVLLIQMNADKLLDIPHISAYMGSAKMLASFLYTLGPGINLAELKGLEAMDRLMPRIMNEDAIEHLRNAVKTDQQRRERKK